MVGLLPLISKPSPNHDPRPDGQTIDMLVFHYTGMVPDTAALGWLTDPQSKVSAHYLIDDHAQVYQLVDEKRRAWHAGVSGWGTDYHYEDGKPVWTSERNINERSIGIEISNPGHDYGYRPFHDRQIDALRELVGDILSRHKIPAHNIVGHSDVAPARKQDPGELFPWQRLAESGIGLWPNEIDWAVTHTKAYKSLLAQIGYPVDLATIEEVVRAFQRRFMSDHINGRRDHETKALIGTVARLVARSVASP